MSRFQDYMAAKNALEMCHSLGIDPADEFGADDAIEAQNFVSSYKYSLKKDTPAKTWWHLDIWNPAIGRALRINRDELGGIYALFPFRLWHDGERHVILTPFPCPAAVPPFEYDWLDIEAVLAWDPVKDTAYVMGDVAPQLIGKFSDDEQGTVYSSPREFLTDLAIARAQFFVLWQKSRSGEWAHGAKEYDLSPGKLAVGDVQKIRWSGLPAKVNCRGLDASQINRALIRQANLPFATEQRSRTAA